MEPIDYSRTSTELDEWFGIEMPIFICVLLSAYLWFVLKLGPNYMKDRAPYRLTAFIAIYNIVQVLICIGLVVEILDTTSLTVLHFWKCKIFEPNTRAEYKFNRITYFTFWLKVAELTETVVFVLRKKQNQVSYLHVFHHCSTISLIYILLKYYRGGSALYPLFLNTNVHIVMYSYYFVAAVCDKRIVQQLTPVKKAITTIQMIQFVLILMQAGSMWSHCDISNIVVMYYLFVISVIFYGFYDFYNKSYTSEKAKLKDKATR